MSDRGDEPPPVVGTAETFDRALGCRLGVAFSRSFTADDAVGSMKDARLPDEARESPDADIASTLAREGLRARVVSAERSRASRPRTRRQKNKRLRPALRFGCRASEVGARLRARRSPGERDEPRRGVACTRHRAVWAEASRVGAAGARVRSAAVRGWGTGTRGYARARGRGAARRRPVIF